jgi:ribonucleoside-diphosphate reductase alpha chain
MPGPVGGQIVKRDGRVVSWDAQRIVRAVASAFHAARHDGRAPEPDAGPAERYGLGLADWQAVLEVSQLVTNTVSRPRSDKHPSVEEIQDLVETMIAAKGHWDVAKRYVLYRADRTKQRLAQHEASGLQDYIFAAKYARYRADLQRRETWDECVARVFGMHRARFAAQLTQPVGSSTLGAMIDAAESAVRNRAVLPSMRSLQFGGPGVEANNARIFNCSFAHIDRLEVFREAFYLLLSGTGVGFSVQKQHVAQLPIFPARAAEHDLPVVHHAIPDSIEGWSDAIHALFVSFQNGTKIEFNYSQIRSRGAHLRTSGGRAPGHLPLKQALMRIEKVLEGVPGRMLRPIEAYDILMHVAVAVLAGGIRRSATICLFSADDEEMAAAKTGNWFETSPQRGKSNNSAVLLREGTPREQFDRLFEMQKQFGEPGFYFTDNLEYGANPCVEIGLAPSFTVTAKEQTKLAQYGMQADVGQRLSGWQMCNLSTINAANCPTPEAFLEQCRHAALIGTMQAAYTDIPYLGPVTRVLNEREALLGVSICGILEQPDVLLDPATLERGAAEVKAINAAVAAAIGIERAARTTCVKPEGTASLLLGTASGIHPHHARHYFRRVQAARTEPIYQWFKKHNPHMTETSVWDPETTDVITFPVSAPESAVLRGDVGAIDFLDKVRLVQKHWVMEGRSHEEHNPGLHHNVSNTVTVKDAEWDTVRNAIWQYRAYYTGISLLAESGDKIYPQAPREEVTTPDDATKWNRLLYTPVDYAELIEVDDTTKLAQEAACAGGACEIS